MFAAASLPYCSTAYNPLGCPLSLTHTLSTFLSLSCVVVEFVIKKKKNQKRGFRSSIDWVCVVYSTQLQYSQRKRNDVTTGRWVVVRDMYTGNTELIAETRHMTRKHRNCSVYIYGTYIIRILTPLFSSRLAIAKGFSGENAFTYRTPCPVVCTPPGTFSCAYTRYVFRKVFHLVERAYGTCIRRCNYVPWPMKN
jgi:hypothetical protein